MVLSAFVFLSALGQDPIELPLLQRHDYLIKTIAVGHGDRPQEGDRVSVHFIARDSEGRVLTDSHARGLPFTFLLGQDTARFLWHQAVRSLRVGGVAEITADARTVGIESSDGTGRVTIRVRLIRVEPLSG